MQREQWRCPSPGAQFVVDQQTQQQHHQHARHADPLGQVVQQHGQQEQSTKHQQINRKLVGHGADRRGTGWF